VSAKSQHSAASQKPATTPGYIFNNDDDDEFGDLLFFVRYFFTHNVPNVI